MSSFLEVYENMDTSQDQNDMSDDLVDEVGICMPQ